jgi:hypothetical protein
VKQSCMSVLNQQGCLQNRVLQTNAVEPPQNTGHAAHILQPFKSKTANAGGFVPEHSTTLKPVSQSLLSWVAGDSQRWCHRAINH